MDDAAARRAIARLKKLDTARQNWRVVRRVRPGHRMSGFEQLLISEMDQIREVLLAKNRAYGNSALDPVRIFSRADAIEQIKVRLDDKLSRLKRGGTAGLASIAAEDVELDLIGYLFLLRIARRIEAQRSAAVGAGAAQDAGADAQWASEAPLKKDQSGGEPDAAFPSPLAPADC